MTLHVASRGLRPPSRRAWSRLRWTVCALSSTERVRPKSYCEPFGSYLIQALRQSMISMPRLPLHGCRCAIMAPSTGCHEGDLPPGHKRDQRSDEVIPANRGLDGRAGAGRSRGYLYDCSGEILFGIARLPPGRRRTELEETGRQFLATVRCEPVPDRA